MGFQERFNDKFVRGMPDECWPWIGATVAGYGQIRIGGGGRMYAHRVAWELANGPIPRGRGYHGMCILHKCDNPPCVNPAHLFLGTHMENHQDKARKGRAPGRKLYGDDNTNSKLTDSEVIAIRSLKGKLLQREIAALYGVTRANISAIQTGRSRTKPAGSN